MSLGSIRGGAIKIGSGHDEIAICEGLEDALSLRLALPDVTVWAAAGGNIMPSMPIPAQCRRLIIARDNDKAGGRAADEAIRAFKRPGREIRVMRPAAEFKDFNEELMGSGAI